MQHSVILYSIVREGIYKSTNHSQISILTTPSAGPDSLGVSIRHLIFYVGPPAGSNQHQRFYIEGTFYISVGG